MNGIPSRCPKCNNENLWEEKVNPLTSGVPIGKGAVRISLLNIRGLFAYPIKRWLGFYKVTYHCKKCGYEETYDLP